MRGRPTLGQLVDAAVTFAGVAVAAVNVAHWLRAGLPTDLVLLTAPLVVVLLAQFPIVISQRSGDVVIGFECSVLVFLCLVTSATETNALWAVGTTAAHVMQRKSWRTRGFNVGLTNLLGPIAVTVLNQNTLDRPAPQELGTVVLGCAIYFLLDLLMTAVSLAADGQGSLLDAVPLRSIPLPLACFVSIDSLGYLAGVVRDQSEAMLVLLTVPVGTIAVAARAVTQARQHEQRMGGLFAAAKAVGRLEDGAALPAEVVRQAESVLRHSDAEIRDRGPRGREIGARLGDGRWLVVHRQDSSGHYFDAADRQALEALVAVATESLERRRLVDELAHLARHDPLTGLGNRALLGERLTLALARGERAQRRVALLYLDLDGFKGVNDRYGHDAGDLLLAAAATRLASCCRAVDTLARLGGDEFAVVLEDIDDEAGVLDVADRILSLLRTPFDLDGGKVAIATCVGVALARPGDTGADLLRNADLALYKAKSGGRGRIEVFEPGLREATVRRLEVEEELRRSLDGGVAVEVVYQPIVDLTSGVVLGFEALARWPHPRFGPVPPEIFVAAAERTGLIDRLGEHVLREAVAGGAALAAAAGRPLEVAVNVSPHQLRNAELPGFLAGLLGDRQDVTVMLELTEGALLADDDRIAEVLGELQALGVQLAVDDFGVGYSSISYLHRLPVSALKVDRSFVSRIPGDARAEALVEAVAAMAEALHLRCIAEGIEHPAAAAFLRAAGCAHGQGYLFGAPLSLDDARRLLQANGRMPLPEPADERTPELRD